MPPPVVALLVAAAMALGTLGLAGREPGLGVGFGFGLPWTARLVASATASVSGGLLALAGFVAFARRRTTINPLHPERATALVTGGPYARTRNPMYLGLLAVLLGWALRLDAWPVLAGPLAFWLYLGRWQIPAEERALAARFGPAYDAYRRRVRRWL